MWGHDEEKKKWQIESDMLTNVRMKRVGKKKGVRKTNVCLRFYMSVTKIYAEYEVVFVFGKYKCILKNNYIRVRVWQMGQKV